MSPLLDSARAHVILSALTWFYAVTLFLVFVFDIGDQHQPRMNLAAWFAWQVFYLLLMIADRNPYTRKLTSERVRTWRGFVRPLASLVVCVQAAAFAVWAIVLWTENDSGTEDTLLGAPNNFYALSIGTLAVQSLLGLCLFWASTKFYSVM